jgi:predicted thioesterase
MEITVEAIDRKKITFAFSVRDPVEECGRGRHVRFVVENEKRNARLAEKKKKAGLA